MRQPVRKQAKNHESVPNAILQTLNTQPKRLTILKSAKPQLLRVQMRDIRYIFANVGILTNLITPQFQLMRQRKHQRSHPPARQKDIRYIFASADTHINPIMFLPQGTRSRKKLLQQRPAPRLDILTTSASVAITILIQIMFRNRTILKNPSSSPPQRRADLQPTRVRNAHIITITIS